MDIPGEPIENQVWLVVSQMISKPKELYETFKRQSVDSRDYDTYMKEREKSQREFDKMEDTEVDIELRFHEGDLSEEKKDKMIENLIIRKNTLVKYIDELDEKLNAIVQSEETRLSLEKFSNELITNIENITFEQKKFLINLLVERIEVTTVATQLNLNIKLRFVQPASSENRVVYQPKKSSPEPQSDNGELDSDIYGATDWARTSDLLLRREAF
jgi:hypothetical protein